MSFHLSPLSRRRFLAGSAATAAGILTLSDLHAAGNGDPHFFALLADTHVPKAPDVGTRGVNMTANFAAVAGELTALKTKPSNVLIGGDCAYLKGLVADYTNMAPHLNKLTNAGMPVHMMLGNHDDRDNFYDVLTSMKPAKALVEGKHVTVIQTPRANWFLLDSLEIVNNTPGLLGKAQLGWLAKALDQHADKPALIMLHHNPPFDAEGHKYALKDIEALYNVIRPRRQVKAMFFGHTHDWNVKQEEGIHLVNLPPTAYVFRDGKPNGWVEAQLGKEKLTLKLHALDKAHHQHGETLELKHR